MALVTSGGQSVHDIYVLKINSGGDDYDVYDIFTTPGTPATVSSPTRTTGKPLKLTEITQTDPAFQDDGTVQITWSNYDSDDDIWTFLDLLAKAPASGNLPEYKLENGTERGGTSDYLVLVISYLMKNENSTPNEIFLLSAIGTIARTSGSFTTNPDDYVKPTIIFNGSKSEIAYTIPTDLFYSHASDPDSGLVDAEDIVSLAPSISKSQCWWRKWVEVPNAE